MRLKKFQRIRQSIAKLAFREKLLASLIVVALLMAAYMGTTFYRTSSTVIYEMGAKLSQKNANTARSLVEQHLKNAFQNATQVIRLRGLREVLKAEDGAVISEETVAGLSSGISEIMTYAAADSDVSFGLINLYCKNGFTFCSNNKIHLPFSDYQECLDYYTSHGYLQKGYNPSTGCQLVSGTDQLGRVTYHFVNLRILYHPSTYDVAGIMLYAVDEDNICDRYSQYVSGAYVMHQNGEIVSSMDKSLLGTSMRDTTIYREILESGLDSGTVNSREGRRTRLVSYSKIERDLYLVTPFEYYTGSELESREFALSSLLIVILGVLFAVGVAAWLSRSLYRSISEVKQVVDRVHDGDRQARYQSDNRDELAYLGNSFNDMLDELERDYETQKLQERTQKNLELRLMQSQINPHLLYNTLDSVLWSLQKNNPERAEELLLHLSSFFKTSLARGSDTVPLRNELELIGHYLEIQRLARKKSFRLEIQVPEELMDYPILKLTLQPVVENAILHGFSGYRDNGTIRITAQIEGRALILQVRDNGIGMEEQELSQLNMRLNLYPPPEQMKSFGLYNVNWRIKNLYGRSFGLILSSEISEYTQARITLPYEEIL